MTTRPQIHELFEFFKKRADHPVDFFEVRSAWPYCRPGDVRAACSKLERQGYIVRLDFNLYQYSFGFDYSEDIAAEAYRRKKELEVSE